MFQHAIVVLERDQSPPIDKLIGFLAEHCRRVTLASAEEGASQQDRREQMLRGLVARCNRRGLHVGVARLADDPGSALQVIAGRTGGDLIVFPSMEDDAGGPWRLTRTRRLALQRSAAPLWFWTEEAAQQPRIAALADPDISDETRQGISIAAIDAAARLANRSGSSLAIVNACLPFGSKTAAESPFIRVAPETLAREREALAEQRRSALTELVRLSGHGLRARDVRVVAGDAVADLPEIVESDYDLVVMGCCGRSRLRALFRPNTAEKLLTRLHCSALVVKTPVLLPFDDQNGLRDLLARSGPQHEFAAL